MKAKYIRVSTEEQNTARQKDGQFKTYEDKCSGSIPFNERPQGKELTKDIESGLIDEVHVHAIDRLGRNTIDILNTINWLTEKGVNLISDKEGLRTLNEDKSENLIAKMIIGVLSTLAEYEKNRIKERVKEGVTLAKERGAYKGNGRPSGTTEDKDEFLNKPTSKKIVKALKQGRSIREVAKVCECSINLVRKVAEVSKLR
jgi:DNA invertase Pin-like site-specific DNA recombinase